MKRQLTAVLLTFVLLLTMTSCSAANTLQRMDAAEDRIEAQMEAIEDKLENSLRKAVASDLPAASKEPTLPTPKQAPPVTEPYQPLSKEQALQIALEHLGFTADQIVREHTEYEIDDGIPQFDVAFHQGDWEYELEIHAESGRILSYDKDHKFD